MYGGACVTYDAVTDFGPSPIAWRYGVGTVGASFTPLPNYVTANCVGITDLACHNDMGAPYTFPAFGKNVSTSKTLIFYTNELTKDELFVQTLPGMQAILRFTAPTTAVYNFSGSFTRLDNSNGSGNGVTVGSYFNGVTTSGDLPTVMGSSFSLDNQLHLTKNSSIDFFLDAKGDVFFDGTGLRLTVASVPETSTWAMMAAGFGLLGGLSRRTRRDRKSVV